MEMDGKGLSLARVFRLTKAGVVDEDPAVSMLSRSKDERRDAKDKETNECCGLR